MAVGSPPDEITFETWIGRHPVDRKRFTSRTDRGKRAITRMRVIERLHGAALVECRLDTGRTHQIRVHLADRGHPVLGDVLYGRAPADPRVRDVGRRLGRQALHATTLGFDHPVTGQKMHFESEVPPDFLCALDALR